MNENDDVGRGLICFDEFRMVVPILYENLLLPPMDLLTCFNEYVQDYCEKKQVPHTHSEALECAASILEKAVLSDQDEDYLPRFVESVCLVAHLAQMKNWILSFPYRSDSLQELAGASPAELEYNAARIMEQRCRVRSKFIERVIFDVEGESPALTRLRDQLKLAAST